jgi:hypothetical protein
MEFGMGGRIHQLWASDPNLPDQNEEFQFVLGPVNLADEYAEDYFPGTILIGARVNPSDPWIVARNTEAEPLMESEDPNKAAFSYQFPLLPEIEATGRFYEKSGIVPVICWDIEIKNGGRQILEIGELGFPFALNNIFEGFPRTREGMQDLLRDRVYIHPSIGGASSYLFAQRASADPPGLVIFPGENTQWEFYHHVHSSLNTPFRWDGIPIIYVHSRACIEREGWTTWFNDHTSLFLEPGDSKKVQICFAPAARDRFDTVIPTLAACGVPAIKVLPSAVAPTGVGIALEVSGARPTQFFANAKSEIETDSDEDGGFCFISPNEPGMVRVGFVDTQGRESFAHVLFTEPIQDLIEARAKWICEHQVVDAPNGNLHCAILPADISTGEPLSHADDYSMPFGIESSLADALFLAEKNTIYPNKAECAILEAYCEEFLLDDVQNPGDGSIGVIFSDPRSISSNTGHARAYPLAFTFYSAMARLARIVGDLQHSPVHYLRLASQTVLAMFRHVPRSDWRGVGVPLMSSLTELFEELHREGESHWVEQIEQHLKSDVAPGRATDAAFGKHSWSLEGFDQAFFGPWIDMPQAEREELISLAYAARSLSPSWWWYGSDKRIWDDQEGPHPAFMDKGELCLGPTSVPHSMMLFETLEADQPFLPESWVRMAFGGMLGIWALVRPDGAATMGFCPDPASKHYGTSPLTGDIGVSLYHYLHRVSCYVLPTRSSGTVTFGCHFSSESDADSEEFIVTPWDGVGRRIVVRQLGLEVTASFGKIKEFRFDGRKRRASLVIENPSDRDLQSMVKARGLWGTKAEANGTAIEAQPGDHGALSIPLALPAKGETRLELRITG